MLGKIKYEFLAEMWRYSGPGGWYFISIPQEIAVEIRENLKWQEEGWGRLKATAQIGASEWETAIWYDTKRKTYLLPIKSEIRKKEKLVTDHETAIAIWV